MFGWIWLLFCPKFYCLFAVWRYAKKENWRNSNHFKTEIIAKINFHAKSDWRGCQIFSRKTRSPNFLLARIKLRGFLNFFSAFARAQKTHIVSKTHLKFFQQKKIGKRVFLEKVAVTEWRYFWWFSDQNRVYFHSAFVRNYFLLSKNLQKHET